MNKKYNLKCILLLFPSLIGIAIFYVVPYFRVIFYSFIDNQFRKNFIGLKNYKLLLQNTYFQLAFKNSLLLILIGVPTLVLSALLVAVLFLNMSRRWKRLRVSFVLPMLLPTSSVVIIWRVIFHGNETVLPIFLLFIWKNIGLAVILFCAAFSLLEPQVYEAAKLDGASGLRLHRNITMPLIMPTIFFVTLLGIVYSFKIFRESFLYFGTQYPPDHSYTLQYYMNNHFLKLNYQNLATAAILTSILIYIIVFFGIKIQKRLA